MINTKHTKDIFLGGGGEFDQKKIIHLFSGNFFKCSPQILCKSIAVTMTIEIQLYTLKS